MTRADMQHCSWNRAVKGLPATIFEDCECSSKGPSKEDLIQQRMTLNKAFDTTGGSQG
jgi:hypothetical protein